VVGQRLRRATTEQAAAAIFGLTVTGDITARDLQNRDKQWTRAKGMDGFCPAGPVVVTGLNARNLRLRARVNGILRQDGSAADMVFSPAEILAFASHSMTIEPGDLLLTGTPSGVGPLLAGDLLELEADGIGVLRVRVVAA
jgi:2-keto-4-pentenoate hydratase/2-oxohepta-3-ene-1,7-dioic acid hydratase in catechol pathway